MDVLAYHKLICKNKTILINLEGNATQLYTGIIKIMMLCYNVKNNKNVYFIIISCQYK